MKHGCITTLLSQNNNQNNGDDKDLHHRKRQRHYCQQRRLWLLFFGIVKVSLWWIISQKVKQSTQHPIALFYVVCVKKLKVNGTVCCPKKVLLHQDNARVHT